MPTSATSKEPKKRTIKAAGVKPVKARTTTKIKVEPALEVMVKSEKPTLHEIKSVASMDFIYARGRRKTAIAKTKLFKNSGAMMVNGQVHTNYFKTKELSDILKAPLLAVGQADLALEFTVLGGGMRGQAEACRLGVARALIIMNPEYRSTLKALGFLKRDPREKERKKYGLKKARRAPQWAKR